MKKYILMFMVVGLMLSSTLVLAHEGEDDDSNSVFNSALKEQREAFKAQMETERKAFFDKLKSDRASFLADLKAKKEIWRTANSERKQEFWNKAKDMVGRRFEMAINNLEKVQERTDEVIEDLKADGENVADAEAALSLSEQKLVEAKEKLEEIKTLLPATTSETITPETFEKIKLLAREAKDLLKESKEYLHEAIKEVKELREEEDDSEED